MAIDLDDEILQDFLVEAGEILELLGEQLVELEQSPDNFDLLNAIFRGFHTIKGGAGFLALDPLVAVCHKAEDVFDILRQGERQVSAELMDVILEVVDIVNVMFDQVKTGVDPEEADESLLTRLQTFTRAGAEKTDEVDPEPVEAVETSSVEETVAEHSAATDIVEQQFGAMFDDVSGALDETETTIINPAEKEITKSEVNPGDITEEEFDNLLDDLHGKGSFSAKSLLDDKKNESGPVEKEITKSEINPGDITEEEFDNLLDELHGKGSFSAKSLLDEKVVEQISSGDITEEEFDNLLDELHGKGKFNSSVAERNTKKKEIVPEVSVTTNNEDAEPQKENLPEHVEPALKNEPENLQEKTKPAKAPVKEKAPAKAKGASKAAPPQAETTVRVDTHILDEIMNMVGELVLVRNRFQTLKASEDEANEPLAKAVSNLDVVTADLQLAVMKTRMQPIKKVFGRFPRVVRDLSRSLKKEIKLELVGEETDLDKNLVEALADPLVHLVRNAVDHGIESPDDREAVGKQREGLVVLSASQEGDHIQLSIKDNGKGMNANVLRKVVVEKGLMDEETAQRLDDKECFNLIFMPGFSTKAEISDVSGRGVGMDVVKTRINQMNGVVEIDSIEGEGSTIIIKVPLTLAIMPTLMVILGGQAFALPLASVLEILDLDLRTTNVVDGQLVIMVRDRALPLFFLSDWLVNDPNYVADKQTTGHVVVVNSGGRQIGFVVDQLIGQEEVVIKPLGAKLHGLDGLAGATITGDGQIALILDVPGLMKRYVA
ncbi:MAG: chemotaxis protein CheA [Methylococcaceae bacterium]|nr:chemotaxis protein CheA [Methylococcaceae bacterium]